MQADPGQGAAGPSDGAPASSAKVHTGPGAGAGPAAGVVGGRAPGRPQPQQLLFGPLDVPPGALARVDVRFGLFALFGRGPPLFFHEGLETGLSLAQLLQALFCQIHVQAGGSQGAHGDQEGGGAHRQEQSTGIQE